MLILVRLRIEERRRVRIELGYDLIGLRSMTHLFFQKIVEEDSVMKLDMGMVNKISEIISQYHVSYN